MNVIIDNDGVKWYPMSRFFQQVLKKAEEAKNFHNTAISKNMRLWHKDLICVLPKNQLLGQWREVCLIAKEIAMLQKMKI